MRLALLNEPELPPQEYAFSGKWSSHTAETRLQAKKAVATVTAAVVKNVPHRKSRMLFASVIFNEVAKGRWPVKNSMQPEAKALDESRWAAFVATQIIGKEVAETLLEVSGQPMSIIEFAGASLYAMPTIFEPTVGITESTVLRPEPLTRKATGEDVLGVLSALGQMSLSGLDEDVDAHTHFQPSSDLIRLWVAGINENVQEIGGEEIHEADALMSAEFKLELSRQIHKVINNFAKRKAYESGRYRITFGGNLNSWLEGLIADHLMLSPRSAVPFLNEFKRQLYEQSVDYAVFKGRWGELVIDDANELVLDLVKRKSRRLLGVLRG